MRDLSGLLLPSLLLSLSLARPASAEEIVLTPRHAVGDSYVLSLRTTTSTEVLSGAAAGKSFEEAVDLDYHATIVILETDAAGRSVRELHEGVRLGYLRGGETGSLFQPGAAYELRRAGDELQLFAADRRLERHVERIVARVLASQFEHSPGPALLEPGRPVEIGESWTLDPTLARRFLLGQGVRVVEFGAPATATLERQPSEGGAGGLVIAYRIPVAWFEVGPLPPNAQTAASEARFEGRIGVPSERSGEPTRGSSSLAMRMNGVVAAPGAATRAVPWRLASSRSSEQHTQRLERRLVSAF